ncbi:MAG: phosphate acyltransferase PlsX [Dehalococcoidia bacterium]|nr:phosphate acyltransferase PlsX [Dehalococcoidia bacterium]
MTSSQDRPRYCIAVDAMGGDHAPGEIVRGAVDAAARGDVDVLLVGEPEAIEVSMPSPVPATLQVVPSQGVITEEEHPLEALRSKPGASMVVAAGLVREGKAHAYVTMGSTGAAMATGVIALGNLEGIERPALGGPFLGLAPKTTLVDLGGSIDSRPSQLLNHGVLGSVFAKVFLDIDNPSVALLSVGSEEGKGNRQVREAYQLFQQSSLNFIGNVEGMDVPLGKANVVVCDGFVGNILMKFAEGLGTAVVEYLRARAPNGVDRMAGELLGELANLTNYVEHLGGGPLLGLNGVAIVGHGRSKAPSVTAAIDMACIALERNLVELMGRELALVRMNVRDEQEK